MCVLGGGKGRARPRVRVEGAGGREQFSVVILDPGGGRAAGRPAGVEGPGQWSAAG